MASGFATVTYRQHRNLSNEGWRWDNHVSRKVNGGQWQPSAFKDEDLMDLALDVIASEMQEAGWITRRTKVGGGTGVEIHELHCYKATDNKIKAPSA